MKSGITHPIVNSPYDEPKAHWHYHRETQKFSRKEGRRPAGYVIASESSKAFAESEFEKYRIVQDRLFESDFDRHIKQTLEGAKEQP